MFLWMNFNRRARFLGKSLKFFGTRLSRSGIIVVLLCLIVLLVVLRKV